MNKEDGFWDGRNTRQEDVQEENLIDVQEGSSDASLYFRNHHWYWNTFYHTGGLYA